MSQDFVGDLLGNAIQEYINERAIQLSDDGVPLEKVQEKIAEEIEKKDIPDIAQRLIEQISDDCILSIYNIMESNLDIELEREKHFLDHNHQLWSRGFDMSLTMYLIVLEASKDYREFFEGLPDSEKRDIQYRYTVLYNLNGRACQEFLEILWLLRGGFADAAFSRCRSIYELSVVSELISENDESVAKSYYEASASDDSEYNWARTIPKIHNYKGKRIQFSVLKDLCTIVTSDKWNSLYRTSCKTIHAAPQATFARIGTPNQEAFVSVGHSDYGLAAPAINSAISLMLIMFFFSRILHSFDSKMYTRVIQKWLDKLISCYSEIEEQCFPFSQEIADNN